MAIINHFPVGGGSGGIEVPTDYLPALLNYSSNNSPITFRLNGTKLTVLMEAQNPNGTIYVRFYFLKNMSGKLNSVQKTFQKGHIYKLTYKYNSSSTKGLNIIDEGTEESMLSISINSTSTSRDIMTSVTISD